MASNETYRAEDYGDKEVELIKKFDLQLQDAKNFFISCIKPRLDRSYKLYMSSNIDRANEIESWQANIFVPYTHAVVETLMPRILDARPDFTVQGRNEDDQLKAEKLQNLTGYTWEIAKMDSTSEDLVRSALVYGNGYLQASWKKDVRIHQFLETKDLGKKKYKWKEKEQVFYDAPYAENVDNYCLWYDWHNVPRESKQFWFKRLVLTGAEIKRRYTYVDKKKLEMAMDQGGGDLTDYGAIRNELRLTQEDIKKNADYNASGSEMAKNLYENNEDQDLNMHEVFEWWRPFEDSYAVMVNKVPILKGSMIPMPYDFKEAPFISVCYLKLPHEFEGIGLPIILENPQIMLNMMKNQRLDAATLNIHKMWIVNPLANIDKNQLVTRPFGIIYSPDPAGVREIEFSDVKSSAYQEEELLKNDMKYASGVDDFSMSAGGGAGSATEIRHLRESTLERVRLFINHLGDGFSVLMRYWMSMHRQFFTKDMIIRIIGEDGNETFPLIEKDDLMGEFDFIASVIPSIAGKNDIDKKQGMDLFQLLINLPFIDPQKLTSKVLRSWSWNLDTIKKKEDAGAPGMLPGGAPPGMEGLPPEMAALMQGQGQQGQETPPQEEDPSAMPPGMSGGEIPPEVMQQVTALLRAGDGQQPAMLPSGFAEASSPINLLASGAMPPTATGIPTSNPRGFNRGGKVNTNISQKAPNGDEAQMLNQAANIQQ